MKLGIKITILLWASVVFSVFGRCGTWANSDMVIGIFDGQKYLLSDFIYFTFNDACISCLLWAIAISTEKRMAWALFAISIGKILDEFTSPFKIGIAEIIIIACSVLYLIYKTIVSDGGRNR